MSAVAMNATQTKKLLRKAVRSLTFSHSRAPGGKTADGYASTLRDDGSEIVVEIVSPKTSGLSAAALAELFDKDQELSCPEFSHPRIEGEDESLFGVLGEIPLHACDLVFEPEMFVSSGIKKEKCGASYCLIARSQGRIVGMTTFSVGLSTFDDASLERPEIEDMLNIYFDIRLNLVYVCAQHRNKGYGKALMAAVADVFRDEILHLSKLLAPVHALVTEPFEVRPYVHSEWYSRTGKLAHMALLDEIDLAVDDHNDLYSDAEPERAALAVSHVDDDAGY